MLALITLAVRLYPVLPVRIGSGDRGRHYRRGR
jgi:hypothetical protein